MQMPVRGEDHEGAGQRPVGEPLDELEALHELAGALVLELDLAADRVEDHQAEKHHHQRPAAILGDRAIAHLPPGLAFGLDQHPVGGRGEGDRLVLSASRVAKGIGVVAGLHESRADRLGGDVGGRCIGCDGRHSGDGECRQQGCGGAAQAGNERSRHGCLPQSAGMRRNSFWLPMRARMSLSQRALSPP